MCSTMKFGNVLPVLTAAVLLACGGHAAAAITMSVSASAPAVGADDIAQLDGNVDIGGNQGHIWSNRPVQGQSFLTGGNPGGYLLSSVTFRNLNNTTTSGIFTIRVGSIVGDVLTPLRTEIAASTISYVPGDFITGTLDTPVWLLPNQLFGVDWGSSGSGFVTSNNTDPASYPDGAAYSSGANSVPGPTLNFHSADRVFHLAMDGTAFVWAGGGTSVDWTDAGNWAVGAPPTSAASTAVVVTGDLNVGTAGAPLNQNIATPLVLNRLQVVGHSTGGVPTTNDVFLGGGSLEFAANGSIAPELAVERNQTVTVRNDLVATGNLTMAVFDGLADADLVVEGQISGGGTLRKTRAGTLIFAGNNSYSGTTFIDAGVLQVGNGETTGTLGSGNVANNASLVFNRSNDLAVSNAISGSGSVTKRGDGTLTFTGSNIFTGAISVDEGTLAVNGGHIRNAASITVAPDATLRFGGSNLLTGSHNTAKSATFHVTLDGGTWVSNSGVCRVGNVNLLNGASWEANVTNWDWGNFYLGLLSDGTDAAVTVGGSSPSAIMGTGNIKLGPNTRFDVAGVTSGPDADLTVAVILDNQTNDQGRAPGGFTKTGPGTMVLTNRGNTYSGGTVVDEGILVLNAPNDARSLVGTGTLTINPDGRVETYVNSFGVGPAKTDVMINGGTLHQVSADSHLRNVTMTGGTMSGSEFRLHNTLVTQAAANTALITAGTLRLYNSLTPEITFDVADGAAATDLSVSSAIRDAHQAGQSAGLRKSGTGTMVLTGSNDFTGALFVDEGTLTVNGGHIRNAASITVAPDATLRFGGTNLLTAGHSIAKSATFHVTLDGGTWVSNSGVCRVGNVNLLNGASWEANVTNWDWGNFYLGLLSDGTDAAVTVGGSSPSAVTGTGNIKLGPNTRFDVADVTSGPAADLAVAVILDNQTNDQGRAPGGFTKTGPGTMVLSGTGHTYTGLTMVEEGALLVNGVILGSVAVGGGTLGGTGGIGGTVTVHTGGTHAPGESVGSQTVGGETWMPGGAFQFEINDALGQPGGDADGLGWDLLTVTGTLDLSNLGPLDDDDDGRFIIDIVSLSGKELGDMANFIATEPRVWPFVQYDQLQGEFSPHLFHLNWDNFANGLGQGHFRIVHNAAEQWLAVGYVPEPGAWLLLLTALMCGLPARRRRDR